MPFAGINVTSIVGDATTGVQAMFPRFTFDTNSRPSLAQVEKYAATAINTAVRRVRFKGYDENAVGDPLQNPNYVEDLLYVQNWIELMVAASVITVLDQMKDNRAYNSRLEELQTTNREFEATEDVFPTLARATTSAVEHVFPSHFTRVRLPRSERYFQSEVSPNPNPCPPRTDDLDV